MAGCPADDSKDLAYRRGLRAFEPQTDVARRRYARRLGEDEAVLVREGLFDARPDGGAGVLDPRPDQPRDAAAGDPAVEGGECLAVLGFRDVNDGAVARRRAVDVSPQDDAVRRDGNRTRRTASRVLRRPGSEARRGGGVEGVQGVVEFRPGVAQLFVERILGLRQCLIALGNDREFYPVNRGVWQPRDRQLGIEGWNKQGVKKQYQREALGDDDVVVIGRVEGCRCGFAFYNENDRAVVELKIHAGYGKVVGWAQEQDWNREVLMELEKAVYR